MDDDLDQYLEQAKRSRRKRLVIAVVAAVLVVGAIVAAVTLLDSPRIDSKLASKIRDAIPHIPAEQRPAFAADALAELEAKRLPAPMLASLREVSSLPKSYGAMALAKALTDPAVVAVWRRACPAGPGALAQAAQLGRGEAVAQFCSACAAACKRLGSPSHGNVAAVAFAALAADELAQHGSLHGVELELLRMLAE